MGQETGKDVVGMPGLVAVAAVVVVVVVAAPATGLADVDADDEGCC